jgi:hypothetical protein
MNTRQLYVKNVSKLDLEVEVFDSSDPDDPIFSELIGTGNTKGPIDIAQHTTYGDYPYSWLTKVSGYKDGSGKDFVNESPRHQDVTHGEKEKG